MFFFKIHETYRFLITLLINTFTLLSQVNSDKISSSILYFDRLFKISNIKLFKIDFPSFKSFIGMINPKSFSSKNWAVYDFSRPKYNIFFLQLK